MSKDDSVATRILDLKREKPNEEWKVSDSEMAMDQLMDLFVKGEGKTLNKEANFDYLAYFFADVARVGEHSAISSKKNRSFTLSSSFPPILTIKQPLFRKSLIGNSNADYGLFLCLTRCIAS